MRLIGIIDVNPQLPVVRIYDPNHILSMKRLMIGYIETEDMIVTTNLHNKIHKS